MQCKMKSTNTHVQLQEYSQFLSWQLSLRFTKPTKINSSLNIPAIRNNMYKLAIITSLAQPIYHIYSAHDMAVQLGFTAQWV